MAEITGKIEAAVFRLSGDGNQYGYVDSSLYHGILSNRLRACRERASLHGDGQSQHASENKSQIVKIKEE